MRYLKLAAAATVYAVACSALTANVVPVLIDQNLSPAVAAATAGLLGIGSITGRLIGGFLLDRFNGNMVAAICVLLPIIPITIFLNTDGSQAWAALACLVMGLSIGTEVDCCVILPRAISERAISAPCSARSTGCCCLATGWRRSLPTTATM
ncbi:MAG: hypothetical protein R3E09_01760 [Novosphingobium sp.]